MRTVESAMTSVPILDAATTIQDAAAAMLDDRVEAAVVVIDGAKRCGLLTAGDVADALAQGRDASSTPIATVSSPEPLRVETQELLVDAHERMRAAGEPLAVVLADD